ncbi:hypothetical protein Tco_0740997, partial [Tanacetum coccineum]
KAKELETISEAILTEAEQLKIITKRSRKESYSSHANGSGANEGTGVSPGVPDAPDYDSDDDISWKSSEDDQDKDKNEDDTFDPIVHTPSHVSSSDDEDSDNEVEGVDVEGEKSDEDATYVEDQGNEADRDTNANLEGRDDVMADVVVPQSSSISSGFVSNMLNPNQDTGVDAIFGHNAEATSLVDIHVTAIAEPSFFAPTNRPPTPTPLFTQLQQPPILTPHNFLELRETNQYAEALSSIPGIVDHYLANKMQEAVDVAVQLKMTEFEKSPYTKIQQFLIQSMKDITIKRPRMGAKMIKNPSSGTDRGLKEEGQKRKLNLPELQEKTTTSDIRKDYYSKTPFTLGVETCVHDERSKEEVQTSTYMFQQPKPLPSPDHSIGTSLYLQFTGPTFELMKGTCKSLTELEYFCEEVYKATTEKLDWINPEGRQYPHDLR